MQPEVANDPKNARIAANNLVILAERVVMAGKITVAAPPFDVKTPFIPGAFCGKELAGNYWSGVHGGGQGVLLSAKT